jgi:hypothetical protein
MALGETRICGRPARTESFTAPGDHVYSRPVPVRAPKYNVRIRLSHAFHANGRELGVIVVLPPITIVDEESGLRLV